MRLQEKVITSIVLRKIVLLVTIVNNLPTPPGGCRMRRKQNQKQGTTKGLKSQKGAYNGNRNLGDVRLVRGKV